MKQKEEKKITNLKNLKKRNKSSLQRIYHLKLKASKNNFRKPALWGFWKQWHSVKENYGLCNALKICLVQNKLMGLKKIVYF